MKVTYIERIKEIDQDVCIFIELPKNFKLIHETYIHHKIIHTLLNNSSIEHEDIRIKYEKIERILWMSFCSKPEFFESTIEDFEALREQFVAFLTLHKRGEDQDRDEILKFKLGKEGKHTFNIRLIDRTKFDFHFRSKNAAVFGTSIVSGLLTNALVPKNSNHVRSIVKVLRSAGVLNVLLQETVVPQKYKRVARLTNLSILFLCTKKLQAENILTQLLDLNNILSNVTPILKKDNVTKQEVEEVLKKLEEDVARFDSIEWNWFTQKEVGLIKNLHSWVLHEDVEKSILMNHLLMIDRVDINTRKQIKFLDSLISLFKNVLINSGNQYGGLSADLNITTKFKESYLFYIKIWGVPSDGMFDDLKIQVVEKEYDAYNILYDEFDYDKFKALVLDSYEQKIKVS
jgi:hypothetical protein